MKSRIICPKWLRELGRNLRRWNNKNQTGDVQKTPTGDVHHAVVLALGPEVALVCVCFWIGSVFNFYFLPTVRLRAGISIGRHE